MTDRALLELRSALLPVLIALLAWLGAKKLDGIESEIRAFRESTQAFAVLQAQIGERQETVKMDRTKLDRVQSHVLSVDGRVQTLETKQVDIERRLDRLERAPHP